MDRDNSPQAGDIDFRARIEAGGIIDSLSGLDEEARMDQIFRVVTEIITDQTEVPEEERQQRLDLGFILWTFLSEADRQNKLASLRSDEDQDVIDQLALFDAHLNQQQNDG